MIKCEHEDQEESVFAQMAEVLYGAFDAIDMGFYHIYGIF